MSQRQAADVTEQRRLNEAREQGIPWKKWGPYLSERQWGTVREDYSEDGNAWDYFPHDQARSRAYRWGEDGLGGISDDKQRLCFAIALVERPRSDSQGAAVRPHQQRGEPRRGREGVLLLRRQHAHALVHEVPLQVPAARVPVSATSWRRTAGGRARRWNTNCSTPAPSTRTGTSTCSWSTRRTAPRTSWCGSPRTTAGPRTRRSTSCPTLWFRNTWSWGLDDRKPHLRADGAAIVASHHDLGEYRLYCDGSPDLLFTENETNTQRLWGQPPASPFVKDGFHEYVVSGRRDAVNPARVGTKAAAHYVLDVPAGGSRTVTVRLAAGAVAAPFDGVDAVFGTRLERGRRVLPADHPGLAERGRAAGAPPGAGRAAVGEAVLLLRPGAVAARARKPSAGRQASRTGCGTPTGSTC